LRQGKPASNKRYHVPEHGPHILAFLRAGMYFKQACLAAGVNPDVAHAWRHLGRLGVDARDSNGNIATEEHVWFYEEVEKALAQFEAEALAGWVNEVRKGNWQASRDLLARRFPRRWGNTEQREIEVHGAQQLQLELVWGDEDQTPEPQAEQLPGGPAGYLEPPEESE